MPKKKRPGVFISGLPPRRDGVPTPIEVTVRNDGRTQMSVRIRDLQSLDDFRQFHANFVVGEKRRAQQRQAARARRSDSRRDEALRLAVADYRRAHPTHSLNATARALLTQFGPGSNYKTLAKKIGRLAKK
jgi:regulator of protease activity HflC (stomatin/prohibitin superfamily)